MSHNTPNKSVERWLITGSIIAAALVSGCSEEKHPVPTREAAVRTLKHNGTVTIRVGAETHTIRHMKDLPIKGFAVFGINLNDKTDFDDEDLTAFKHLTTLRRLSLNGTSVSDESSSVYATLENLSHLHLSSTRITDKTLETLANLPALIELDLENTTVTGEGITKISETFSLQRITLTNTNVKAADLRHLTPLYNLTEILIIGADRNDLPIETFKTHTRLCSIVTEDK